VLTRLAEILFVQVLRAYIESSDATSRGLAGLADPNTQRSLRAIHEAPGEPWTVATLAAKAGLSRTTFSEKFHKLVGTTPMQYLMAWRIEQAKVALSDPSIAIALIAERVGYKSEAAFSRAFKNLAGVGPGQYRARHRVGE
jgi:AraC-like DNA-binding protein